ncbi:MAG: biopolymer transporter ExbD [Prevotella sp.]|nr:biopolymer transporter ExbD [Prevotella sp.]
MSRFRRTRRELPGLNTAALPDLIFTVLFFFMIVTHMRDDNLRVHYQVPQGTEVEKLARQSTVVNIYIGRAAEPYKSQMGEGTFIQLNNQIVRVDQIERAINAIREQMPAEDRPRLTVSIRADRDVRMGIINDVKQALVRANALKVNYSANKVAE